MLDFPVFYSAAPVATSPPPPPPTPVAIGAWDTTRPRADDNILPETLSPVDGITVSDWVAGIGWGVGDYATYAVAVAGIINEGNGADASHAAAFAANRTYGCVVTPPPGGAVLTSLKVRGFTQNGAGVASIALWVNGVLIETSDTFPMPFSTSLDWDFDPSPAGRLTVATPVQITISPRGGFEQAGSGANPADATTFGLTGSL